MTIQTWSKDRLTRVRGAIDFKEIFVPTARISPMRLVSGIRVALNLKRHHLDVDKHFSVMILMNYMEKVPHFQDSKYPSFMGKLKKSIYGLKQSSRM